MARKDSKQTSKGTCGPKKGVVKESDHKLRLRTKADERVRERRGPGVELIPSEVWAVIVGYALQADFDSEFDYKFTHRKTFRLLCRSITAGLEEWIRQGMERDVMKESGSLRLGYPVVQSSSVPPLRLQKEVLIALSRAPKEFLWSVTRLPTTFLSHYSPSSTKYQRLPVGIDIVQSTVLELKNVTRIDGPFLPNLNWPDTVIDLSHMTQLKVIGNDFLRGSVVRDVLLPSKLAVIGDDFMHSSHISRVDLSQTAVKQIGSGFLAYCNDYWDYPLTEVRFPVTLQSVGNEFLAENHSMGNVDLLVTVLESVGDDFLWSTHVRELLLPATLKRIGRSFLSWGGTTNLDLSHTAIQDMDSFALFRGFVEEVILPRTVEEIGKGFLNQCRGLKKVDLSRTQVVTVGSAFLYRTSVDELILPATLRSCSSLDEASLKNIDLSRVGPEFELCALLSPDSKVELLLPNRRLVSGRSLYA